MRRKDPVVCAQVAKHREFALAGQKDRLHRDDSGWNYGRQLVRDALGICSVSNDEANHIGQSLHCTSQVRTSRLVEVEQNWQVVTLAQLVSQSVENCLSLIREAAKD